MLYEVLTSEKVPFTYRVAGPGSRMLAGLVDLGFLLVLALMGLLLASVLDIGRAGLGTAVALLWLFGLFCGYFVLSEWLWLGQTPGKRALRIRVIDSQGVNISFAQAALRNLVRVIDLLPGCFGVGLTTALLTRWHQRLGDLAAGTLVVHLEEAVAPSFGSVTVAAPAARERLQTVKRAAERLSREQKQTLLELCLRSEQLRVPTRTRFFSAVADYQQQVLGLPKRPFESDEKYVLGVAAVLQEVLGGSQAKIATLRAPQSQAKVLARSEG